MEKLVCDINQSLSFSNTRETYSQEDKPKWKRNASRALEMLILNVYSYFFLPVLVMGNSSSHTPSVIMALEWVLQSQFWCLVRGEMLEFRLEVNKVSINH